MEKAVGSCNFVLVVCTEVYCGRFLGQEKPGIGRGANFEGAIITRTLYDASLLNSKFVPIYFEPADEVHVPTILCDTTRYCLMGQYEDLYRRLTAQPLHVPEPLGPIRRLEPPPAPDAPAIVTDTGNLILLGEGFFEAIEVHENHDGLWTLTIPTTDPDQEARLRKLRPGRYGSSVDVQFAHRNRAMRTRIRQIDGRSTSASSTTWTVVHEPNERSSSSFDEFSWGVQGRTFSADDLAEVRARAILLGERPTSPDIGGLSLSLLDIAFQARGVQAAQVSGIVAETIRTVDAGTLDKLRCARLMAVYFLLTTETVEHVHTLELGPLTSAEVRVRLQGERRGVYSNRPPMTLRVEGVCSLA